MKIFVLFVSILFSGIYAVSANEDIELCKDNYSFENGSLRVGHFYNSEGKISVLMEESFFPKLVKVQRFSGVVSIFDIFKLEDVQFFIGAYSSSKKDVALNGLYRVGKNKQPQLVLEFERGKILRVGGEVYLISSSEKIHEYETIIYKLSDTASERNMRKMVTVKGKFLSGFSFDTGEAIITGIDSERRTWGIILNSDGVKSLECNTSAGRTKLSD